MSKFKRPRLWACHNGSSTMVLYDPCDRGGTRVAHKEITVDKPAMYMFTNLGWVGPVDVDLTDGETLESACEKVAKGYELVEQDRDRAIWAVGCEGREEEFE